MYTVNLLNYTRFIFQADLEEKLIDLIGNVTDHLLRLASLRFIVVVKNQAD